MVRVLLALLVISGAAVYGPWAAMTVRCLHQPVATSTFAAAYSYLLPGDSGYPRFWLFHGYVCTEADARANGFHHSPLAE